jgi:FtsZ-binding cell division protein ZapB
VNVEKTHWALETEARLGTELQQRCSELAQCVEVLHQAEQTAEERRVWAEKLKAEVGQLERQVILMKESRWVKLGRTFGLGPDLRNR